MLEVTYAMDDDEMVEIEISGSLEEIRGLEKALHDIAVGKLESTLFEGRTDFVPEFNDGLIREVVFRKGDGDVTVTAKPKGSLSIEGSPEKLHELSGYFYFDEEDKDDDHHHCEWREDHPCLSPVSIPLIIRSHLKNAK